MSGSWKTTAAGILMAVGTAFSSTHFSPEFSWLGTLGQIFTGIGALWMGGVARDNNVSSEQAGIK